MRILVCGAHGFIGSAICARLQQAGHIIIKGVRKASLKNEMEINFSADITEDVWINRLHQIDAVINAVGILVEQGDQKFSNIHTLAPIALFAACAKDGIKRVLQVSALQVSPEKVKLLKPDSIKAEAPPNPKPALACLEWGGFTEEDAVRAAAELAKLAINDKVTQRETGDVLYWTYIPALKTQADANKKAAQVKALGITDFSVLQDNGAWIVSLGAFKTEDNAKQQLAQLNKKGVRSAIVGQRGTRSTLFVIRDPGDEVATRLAALKTQFPNAPLKVTDCVDAPQAKN